MARGVKRQIRKALENVNREISLKASGGGRFAGGLASEGYAGGYRDALYDVQLAMEGTRNDSRFWPQEALRDE